MPLCSFLEYFQQYCNNWHIKLTFCNWVIIRTMPTNLRFQSPNTSWTSGITYLLQRLLYFSFSRLLETKLEIDIPSANPYNIETVLIFVELRFDELVLVLNNGFGSRETTHFLFYSSLTWWNGFCSKVEANLPQLKKVFGEQPTLACPPKNQRPYQAQK